MATGTMPTNSAEQRLGGTSCAGRWPASAPRPRSRARRSAPVLVTMLTACASPSTQGNGTSDPGGGAALERSRRVLRELPVGVVDLHLRDRHRLRAAGAHQHVRARWRRESSARRSGSRPAARRCRSSRSGSAATSHHTASASTASGRASQTSERRFGADATPAPRAGCHVAHATSSTTSNMPTQPSSVNSD